MFEGGCDIVTSTSTYDHWRILCTIPASIGGCDINNYDPCYPAFTGWTSRTVITEVLGIIAFWGGFDDYHVSYSQHYCVDWRYEQQHCQRHKQDVGRPGHKSS